jgi:hypothetical protein
MNETARRNGQRKEQLTTQELRKLWKAIRSDPDARGAFKRLAKAGFRISHLKPSDATFKHPNWADYIAALPLVPNSPSTRRIHRKIKFRKYQPLVEELRQFAAKLNAWPFVKVTIVGEKDCPNPATSSLQGDLSMAATILEDFLCWDYCVQSLNPRHALIAELRWTIRERTGKPHDRELNVLFDAAFRAAGYKEGCEIDPTTLDRIEKRQKESRVKAHRRTSDLGNASSLGIRRSTRNRRKSRKRV